MKFATNTDLIQFVAEHQAEQGKIVPISQIPHTNHISKCIHLGEPTGETIRCATCSGTVELKILSCAIHGECTPTKPQPGLSCCAMCSDYRFKPNPVPLWDRRDPIRFDHTNLFPHLTGKRFNAGIIRWEDGYVFTWRDGWAGSNIWLCRLNNDLVPISDPVCPHLTIGQSNYGREDPQLFIFNKKLHIAFVGVQGINNWVQKTNVIYARLSSNFKAEEVYHAVAPGVDIGRWQKNWGWFQHKDSLYAIYSVSPHRILRVDRGVCEWVAETPYPHHWSGGEQRGGATPVLVNDEWWCFFHDSIGDRKLYRVGLYTFENKPPFRVKRFVPYPILSADLSVQHDNYCDVIFPRGAVLDGDHWLISSGVHDRWAEVRAMKHSDLEKQLISN